MKNSNIDITQQVKLLKLKKKFCKKNQIFRELLKVKLQRKTKNKSNTVTKIKNSNGDKNQKLEL